MFKRVAQKYGWRGVSILAIGVGIIGLLVPALPELDPMWKALIVLGLVLAAISLILEIALNVSRP